MRLKKKLILIMFFILIPVIFAGVTRNVPSWNCPSGFIVTLTPSGAITSYGVEETLGQDWTVSSSTPFKLKDPNPNDGIKQVAWFGISPSKNIIYTLVITPGSYEISGDYVLDSGGKKQTGIRNFIVREDTCIGGTEEDLDSDGYGPGCSCLGSDCNDNDASINPGMTEINNNGVDEDCDGCIYIDIDGDGFPTTSACGTVDCCDSGNENSVGCSVANAFNMNPGITENNLAGNNCDGIDNDCSNGDCCPSTDQNDLSYYDQDCDGQVDGDKKLLFIQKFLAGVIDPPLQLVIDNILGSGYSNP